MAEPVRVCTKCEERKPWSAFSPRSYWDDGTIRNVHGKCKVCLAARARDYRQRDPDNTRQIKARYWQNLKQDKRRHRAFREKQREYNATYNEKCGRVRNPGIRRDVEPAKRLPLDPFRAWLQATFDDPGEASRATGLDDAAMNRYFHGKQPSVSVDTVDRACLAMGDRIDDIYG